MLGEGVKNIMKCVLLSVNPRWVAKILNGEKTIEVRKKFPKDFRGWVYIYCTKDSKNTCLEYADNPDKNKEGEWCITGGYPYANGKVVARFWCDKVEDIACEILSNGSGRGAYVFTNTYNDIREASCLSTQDLIDYLGAKPNGEIVGKAIHISQLEIFDKPKELNEFEQVKYYKNCNKCPYLYDEEGCYLLPNCHEHIPLTKAPQSWQYIEVEE